MHVVQLMPLPSPSSLASFKHQNVLTFLVPAYPVVLEKRPLNGGVSVTLRLTFNEFLFKGLFRRNSMTGWVSK